MILRRLVARSLVLERATRRFRPLVGVRFALGMALAVQVGACGPAEESPITSFATEPHSPVVARIGEHEVTAAEIDARILELPPSERPAPGADLDAWYEELIREMVVDSELRLQAEGLAEESAFRQACNDAEKQVGLQLCLAALRPELHEIGIAELQAAYEERSATFSVPERRLVYHLFLRRGEASSVGDRLTEIEGLRQRVLRGESFSSLAERHSDSESRHRQGALGWITPGILPAGFESVAFDLVEGVPSEPVTTRDGFHLFYVDQVLAGRTAGFEEVRGRLAQILLAERRALALEELVAEVQIPDDALMLDRGALTAVLEAGEPEAVVLRVGETKLDLGDLRRAVGLQRRGAGGSAAAGGGAPLTVDTAWGVLEELHRRELIHHHCRETGKIPAEALEARLSEWRDNALLELQRQRRLVEVAGRDEERLRLFYKSNLGDFSTRPQWHLLRLEVPLGDDPTATMARLEVATRRQQSGIEELAKTFGGEVDDLGFVDLATLVRLAPGLPGLVAPLNDGELTPPVRLDDRLLTVQVMESRDSEAIPFDDVRKRVAAAYVEQYTREVYEVLEQEILGNGAGLEIDREALVALREAGLERSEVRVEELEALLEEL